MSILDFLLAKLAPYECLGCGGEGDLLCRACISTFPLMPARCYRCHRPARNSLTCLTCLKTTHLYRVQAVAVYTGASKDLVWKLKSNGAQAAAAIMGDLMSAKVVY